MRKANNILAYLMLVLASMQLLLILASWIPIGMAAATFNCIWNILQKWTKTWHSSVYS